MRSASLSDVPSIVKMMEQFHASADQPQEFDAKSAHDFMAGMIEAGQIVLHEADGFICGFIVPSPINSKWLIAMELFWWSEASGGIRLMKAFMSEAEAREVSEIRFSCQASTPKVGRFLERAGFGHDEQVYKRVI